jgi:hypothetical protein
VNAKYYTLAEARAALPQVKRYMNLIQAARSEILRLRPDALPAIQRAAMPTAAARRAGELARACGCAWRQGHQGHSWRMGVLVKDVGRAGWSIFIGTRHGREVYLCWHHGEDDIAYWHEVNAGVAGRRPDRRARGITLEWTDMHDCSSA